MVFGIIECRIYILHTLCNSSVRMYPPISPMKALLIFSLFANMSVYCFGHLDEKDLNVFSKGVVFLDFLSRI